MKAAEMREMYQEELLRMKKDLNEELFNLRFQKAMSQLSNPMRIRHVKKELARVQTILNEMNTSV
ncbi:MAG: 50S ribosomal protein L29 [Thermodesulfobacteriota bacterium]|nr:50S ribosomal protein L29 [Thermodesulfobacteriota bacterium]